MPDNLKIKIHSKIEAAAEAKNYKKELKVEYQKEILKEIATEWKYDRYVEQPDNRHGDIDMEKFQNYVVQQLEKEHKILRNNNKSC
jgi:trans-aconitate methyltransferase